MGKTFEVQREAAQLEDGAYRGIISEIKYREQPYEYADIYIAVNESDTKQPIPNSTEVKVGYPSFISPTSGFGKLLIRMNVQLEVGQDLDPERELVGKSVKFMIMQQKSKKDGKMYARVLPDSVKPSMVVRHEKVN